MTDPYTGTDNYNSLTTACQTLGIISSQNSSLRFIKYLMEKYGYDVDERDRFGWTPLTWAASTTPEGVRVGMEVVKYLVEECDANVFKENSQGKRASEVAETEEIREYLLEIEECASLQKHS